MRTTNSYAVLAQLDAAHAKTQSEADKRAKNKAKLQSVKARKQAQLNHNKNIDEPIATVIKNKLFFPFLFSWEEAREAKKVLATLPSEEFKGLITQFDNMHDAALMYSSVCQEHGIDIELAGLEEYVSHHHTLNPELARELLGGKYLETLKRLPKPTMRIHIQEAYHTYSLFEQVVIALEDRLVQLNSYLYQIGIKNLTPPPVVKRERAVIAMNLFYQAPRAEFVLTQQENITQENHTPASRGY